MNKKRPVERKANVQNVGLRNLNIRHDLLNSGKEEYCPGMDN
jgi:hypothetical protein